MVEFLFIIIVGITFAKASVIKKNNSIIWALIGIIYFAIGRIVFSTLLYSGYWLFSEEIPSFRIIVGLRTIEIISGIIFGLATAFILGEISGLNIKKVISGR